LNASKEPSPEPSYEEKSQVRALFLASGQITILVDIIILMRLIMPWLLKDFYDSHLPFFTTCGYSR
jgi:hypothetical protein